MSIIRQQRHLGTRVMIATQEPTLDTRLLDLCNVVIVHHFSSPAWFDVLKGHLAGSRGDKERSSMINEIFSTIVKLKTGHALVFAPRAMLHIQANVGVGQPAIATLGDGYVRVIIRPRVTADGGRSITAQDVVEIEEEEVELPAETSRDGDKGKEEDLETGSITSSTSTLTDNDIKGKSIAYSIFNELTLNRACSSSGG